MRFKSARIIAALALLTLASAHAAAQTQQDQKDEQVIDDFVKTRGIIFEVPSKAAAKPKPGTRRRPTAGVAKAKPSGGAKQGGGAVGSADVAQQQAQPAGDSAASDATPLEEGVQIVKASAPQALALGYSIYMRDEATGGLLPAPAGKTYVKDDSIVMVLETNSDGYLYVFDAENNKDPVMIYPDARVHDGTNDVRAHIRETYPDDPELPSFTFDARPAVEHVYIVFSREPLAGVPTGAALKKYCGKSETCEWRPSAAQWARISAAALNRGVREGRGTQIAQADTTPVMPATLQRGIRIKKDAPRPMNVRFSDSPAAPMVVTKLELLHK